MGDLDQRARFVLKAEPSDLSFAELCRRHGISCPTGYEWLGRYRQEGPDGLSDRSRRPHSSPHATPQPVVVRILEVRKHPSWGSRKIRR